jgi:predicted O-linked N-acetylglucosamine transferase (SPINDLY family)
MSTQSSALQRALEHHQAGRLDVAQALYRQVLEAEPEHPDALHLYGLAAHQQGHYELAAGYIQRAIAVNANAALYYVNLGVVYRALGRNAEAECCHRHALRLNPDSVEALSNLGVMLQDQEQLAEAIACYRRALELKPDYADAANNLGIAFQEQGELDEAVTCYERALQLNADSPRVYNNLGGALRDMGRIDEALHCFEQALDLNPEFAEAHSNLLLTLQCREGATLAELAAAHARYESRHAAPLRAAWQPHRVTRDPGRRLRVGFVSADLAAHPVGHLSIRAVEHLDRRQCEVVCYSDRIRPDLLTRRFQVAAGLWRDVAGVPDEQLAAQIRADQVDILFDLAGHTARNRMLMFARKPAPIQITWLGYVGTTGLAAMDYILADRHQIPPESQRSYAEKVLRMPDGYACFEPPADAPPVNRLPALTAGHVTLGSFNNPAKISRQTVAAWAAILNRVPHARLILKYRGLDGAGAQTRLRQLFAAHGVPADRVQFFGHSPAPELLAWYGRLDLALDTLVYSGGLTTCEALWMGVPVITCPGATFASRHARSHLSTAGITETIAHTPDDYVELTVRLLGALPRLAEMRAGLRARVAASPLCNGPRFADNLMQRLRGVWCDWCLR